MEDIKVASMVLFGRSGAGKSTFINYLVGENVAPTGCGEPVTQGFDEYEFIFPNKFKMHIYDSKGLEVDNLESIKSEINSFITKKSESHDPSKWIHAIFYCINAAGSRFESTEIQFIEKIQEISRQQVNIILTHCEQNNRNNVDSFVTYIKEQLGNSAIVFCVNSVDKTNKKGQRNLKFGREVILKNLQDLLWKNVSERIATDYANEVNEGLHRIINIIEKEQLDYIDSIPLKDIWILYITGKYPEQKLDKNDELIDFIGRIDKDYTSQLKAFSCIFCSFAESITKQMIKINAPLSIAESSILDDSVEKSLNNWVQQEIASAQEELKLNFFSRLKNNLEHVKEIREYYKKPITEMCNEMRRKVPEQDKIKQRVKNMLYFAKEQDMRHSSVIRLAKKVGRNEQCPCGSGKKFKYCHLGKGIYD